MPVSQAENPPLSVRIMINIVLALSDRHPTYHETSSDQVSSINAQLSKLKVLDALSYLLNKVTEALDRFAAAIDSTSQKAGDNSAPSAGLAGTHPVDGKKYISQATITQLFQRRHEKYVANANLNKEQTIP
ncbi:hypothetical protein Tco_0932445 [Tanacetum coccineum]